MYKIKKIKIPEFDVSDVMFVGFVLTIVGCIWLTTYELKHSKIESNNNMVKLREMFVIRAVNKHNMDHKSAYVKSVDGEVNARVTWTLDIEDAKEYSSYPQAMDEIVLLPKKTPVDGGMDFFRTLENESTIFYSIEKYIVRKEN